MNFHACISCVDKNEVSITYTYAWASDSKNWQRWNVSLWHEARRQHLASLTSYCQYSMYVINTEKKRFSITPDFQKALLWWILALNLQNNVQKKCKLVDDYENGLSWDTYWALSYECRDPPTEAWNQEVILYSTRTRHRYWQGRHLLGSRYSKWRPYNIASWHVEDYRLEVLNKSKSVLTQW